MEDRSERMDRILGVEEVPTGSPEEATWGDMPPPQNLDEGNVVEWGSRMGLDGKDLLEKFRELEEDGTSDPLILDISTGGAVDGFLDKSKVEALMKKKNWAFLYVGFHTRDKGKLLIGTFAGHIPSRRERVAIGLHDHNLRGGVGHEALDGETLTITRGTAVLTSCLDHHPTWFSYDIDAEEMIHFYEIVGEVEARTSSFR